MALASEYRFGILLHVMNHYATALSAYLAPGERTQEELAAKIKRTQAAVNRYANGVRFPDADTARAIERETSGAVPFSIWQSVALARLGIEEAA